MHIFWLGESILGGQGNCYIHQGPLAQSLGPLDLENGIFLAQLSLRCNLASINLFYNKSFQIVCRNVKISAYQVWTTARPWPSSNTHYCIHFLKASSRIPSYTWSSTTPQEHFCVLKVWTPKLHSLSLWWAKPVLSKEERRWGDRELIRSSSESSIWWEMLDSNVQNGNISPTIERKQYWCIIIQHESSSDNEDDFLETQVITSTSSVQARSWQNMNLLWALLWCWQHCCV